MNKKDAEQVHLIVQKELKKFYDQYFHPPVDLHVLPGGTAPKRMTDEAIGYDASLRAIVCPHRMDSENPHLRKTLCDFKSIISPEIRDLVYLDKEPGWKKRRLCYHLHPGEMVLCGVGFVTQMPFSMCANLLCRSGMSSKLHITVANGPGTIDPDYLGEAGANLHNCGKKTQLLWHGRRIVQFKFDWAVIPRFRNIPNYADLRQTKRGTGGFGSTGF